MKDINIDTKAFGKFLRSRRLELDLTIKEVASASYLHPESITRIEYGRVVPKYETLECLSVPYKMDLNLEILKYREKNTIEFEQIVTSINNSIQSFNSRELNISIDNFKNMLVAENNNLYDYKIKQMLLFSKSVDMHSDNFNRRKNILALQLCVEAMCVTIPTFKIKNIIHYRVLTSLELRILINIGTISRKLGFILANLRILKTCENCIVNVSSDDKIIVQLYYNLTLGYLKLGKHNEALTYTDKGIKLSLKYNSNDKLHLLYYNSALIKFKLNMVGYEEDYNQSILLANVFKDNYFLENAPSRFNGVINQKTL